MAYYRQLQTVKKVETRKDKIRQFENTADMFVLFCSVRKGKGHDKKLNLHLVVGLTNTLPEAGKQRPGAAQSISNIGTGGIPMSTSILA